MGDACSIVDTITTVCVSTPPLPATGDRYGLLVAPVGFCLLIAGAAAVAWVREGRR